MFSQLLISSKTLKNSFGIDPKLNKKCNLCIIHTPVIHLAYFFKLLPICQKSSIFFLVSILNLQSLFLFEFVMFGAKFKKTSWLVIIWTSLSVDNFGILSVVYCYLFWSASSTYASPCRGLVYSQKISYFIQNHPNVAEFLIFKIIFGQVGKTDLFL